MLQLAASHHPSEQAKQPVVARSRGDITQLLAKLDPEKNTSFDQLFSTVYTELNKLARCRLARESTLTQLDAPGLVHEVYLRLLQRDALCGMNRNSFFSYASTVMRSVVVDYVRQRQAKKRGGVASPVTLHTEQIAQQPISPDVEALDNAMQQLQHIDERCCQIVEMRYFGGLSLDEIAEVLQISPVTAWRSWEKARIFLYQAIQL